MLQANNDIRVNEAIDSQGNASPGDLTLQAGRSIERSIDVYREGAVGANGGKSGGGCGCS